MKNITSGINRRRFLAAAGVAAAAPLIVPSNLFGAGAPSNRITMGVVGWGMQGPGNTGNFMNHEDCQVVAVCDIDKKHLEQAKNSVNNRYKNQDCKTYSDYRELMAQKDIDTVMLALPDNWHMLTAVEAANQKKDIYGEKPLARTIVEQQAIVKAVQANQRIWQTGSWQRSEKNFHYGAEIVRNGLIGKVTRVEVGLPSGHNDFAGTRNKMAVTEPPSDLDYSTWIGPAKMEPYIEGRVHKNWRWNYNIGGGQLLDWIGHHCDIGHWGLGNDDKIGPFEIEGEGEFPPPDAIWNTCTKYRVECKYPDGITMILAGGHRDIRGGTKWIGTEGWVWVNRGNAFESSNAAWGESRTLPDAQRKVKLPFTTGKSAHYRNFLDSVKSRKPTVAPVEVAHHSAIPGHLGLIAMLVKRKIKWDPAMELIVGDAEASKLLTRPYREPWKMV